MDKGSMRWRVASSRRLHWERWRCRYECASLTGGVKLKIAFSFSDIISTLEDDKQGTEHGLRLAGKRSQYSYDGSGHDMLDRTLSLHVYCKSLFVNCNSTVFRLGSIVISVRSHHNSLCRTFFTTRRF
jgi:hypothetical protein